MDECESRCNKTKQNCFYVFRSHQIYKSSRSLTAPQSFTPNTLTTFKGWEGGGTVTFRHEAPMPLPYRARSPVSGTLIPDVCSELCGSPELTTPTHWQAEPQRCGDDLHARNAGGGPKSFRTWLLLCLNTHLNPDLEAPRSLAKVNYWQLLKSPLHVQFSLLESSFLPRANAAHTPGFTQIPAPVGSNTQTTQAVWALPALLCPLFFST